MSIIKTRRILVNEARDLFAHKGFENTTMNDIAKNSQKGRRTLYTYFKNKEDIYNAVIESELENMSERLEEEANKDVTADQKIVNLIYTHLTIMKETVKRNGNLRAEFFRNIWMVERVRKAFDQEERELFERVLQEGCDSAKFRIENVKLIADIIHCCLKGIEVPYIYGRIGEGLTDASSKPVVVNLVRRALGVKINF